MCANFLHLVGLGIVRRRRRWPIDDPRAGHLHPGIELAIETEHLVNCAYVGTFRGLAQYLADVGRAGIHGTDRFELDSLPCHLQPMPVRVGAGNEARTVQFALVQESMRHTAYGQLAQNRHGGWVTGQAPNENFGSHWATAEAALRRSFD